MIHGEKQIDLSTPSAENVESGNRGRTPQVTTANDNSTTDKKEIVFERVERGMELLRKGECSRFRASSLVLNELDKWIGVSDKEKGKDFDSYLAEINSHVVIQDELEDQLATGTREGSPALGTPLGRLGSGQRKKRIREEVEGLLDQVSRGEQDGGDNEPRVIRRRAREEEMPWYNSVVNSSRRNSCVETCRILLQFSEDFSSVKSLLRIANNLPEGIPSSQWDRLLRGESIDLNQILASMHFVNLDEEGKGRVGPTEVVFAAAESKRQVRTGAEWSSAFRRMSKAVTFLFPHRREELLEYAEHIEGLFSAKQTSAHSKVILYDQSVRNQVGGGQNILLTDYHRFNALREAILHADGIEYKGHGEGPSKGGEGAGKREPSKKDICRRFNGQAGRRFSKDERYYKHPCKECGKGGHGKSTCTSEKH